jgi:exodeoxyribonuclease V
MCPESFYTGCNRYIYFLDIMRASKLLVSGFPFEPTYGQLDVFSLMDKFLEMDENSRPAFLLKGYAGTGKTTIVSQLVKILPQLEYGFVLIAPTGRAAKVMSAYSGKQASTIHKHIFSRKQDGATTGFSFHRKKNYLTKTIFIVDEASMISDEADFGARGLLTELITYVFEKKTNKLLIIGDSAQLPPVMQELSPALDPDYLKNNFQLDLLEYEMKEVMRQQTASGILANATALRENIRLGSANIKFQTKGYPDIYKMNGDRLEDGLRYAYNKYGHENTIVICRSNKAATQYNEYIRRTINSSESEINAGDILMIVRNNYTALPDDSPAGFIANGDFAEVIKIKKFEDLHELRFAVLELKLSDYPGQPSFEAKAILDVLHSFSPNLGQEDHKKLYESVQKDYPDLKSKAARTEAIRKDPYLNALQIKFAYALTCHKSQGGQWDAVFIDQGFLKDEMINKEFLRWLYTAVTRARKEVFLVNFHPRFFEAAS